MCSVNDGNNCECLSNIILKSKETNNSCVKCKKNAIICIRMNDSFCKDCFIPYCVHKYRSTFGKSKLVRDSERVILAFSGGSSSSAMLHLTKEGKSVRAAKKLRYTPILIYINENMLFYKNQEDINAIEKKILTKLQDSGFPFKIIDLNKILDITVFNCLNCSSDKEEFLKFIRYRILAKCAKIANCTKILLGNSSTNLSIDVLSNVIQGRGSQVANFMKFDDNHHEDVIFIRGLRELTSKEITMYNKLNNIEIIPRLNFTTMKSNFDSLQKLTENFVLSLQSEFPSTCSTLFRSGEKLEAVKNNFSRDDNCIFCMNKIDLIGSESSAFTAAQFSQKNHCVYSNERNLCFGCLRIFQKIEQDIDIFLPNFSELDINFS